jgi:Glycosyl transferase family 2
MPTITIAILTLNEAKRIERCIASAKWADQVVVIDSGSTDGTAALAQAAGAQVFVYADWRGFAQQRNRMLSHCTADYVFCLDADEELTPALSAEIREHVAACDRRVGRVAWELVAFGRPLKHMKTRGYINRFFLRSGLSHFEGVVHETAIPAGDHPGEFHFKNRLPHHSRETVYASLQKLAQYAHLGAAKRAEQGKRGGVLRGFASAFASFIRTYVMERGFLCGAEGFLHCFFVSLECFFRYVAIRYDKDILHLSVKRN